MPSTCRRTRRSPSSWWVPGTGVAPFRAFLQERQASGAAGKNWLFFGHQRQTTDFFYRDEFEAMREKGLLTRLSLAWSRDAGQKFYVQDRMREVGPDVWAWIEQGAHIYVCGDAKRMAKDVEGALIEIVATHGHQATGDAIAFREPPQEGRPLPARRLLNRRGPRPASIAPPWKFRAGVIRRRRDA